MSNSQLPPNSNLVLAPEWAALAKIGKVFHWMYILIIFSILFTITIVAGAISLELPSLMSDPEALMEAHPIFSLFFLVGVVVLGIWSIIVGIMMLIRVWATPESIVPGGGIGRTYVILALVTFAIIFCAGILKEFNPQVSLVLQRCGNICSFIGFILFLVYEYRLGNAIGSQRVKSCVKWFIYGYIFFIALVIAGTILRLVIGGILVLAGGVFGLVAFLSYLNSFGYVAKDIKAFIQKHLQEYANAINTQNQPEEGTDF